jgi:mRNA-degrading endonuclease RelE of RelBE toxin-antitoxin system
VPTPRAPDDWPDFTFSARLQFWSLPPNAIEAFAAVFAEFARFPQRPSEQLDVSPLRSDPNRWRLKVAGYRALYQIRQGRPVIEAILPRTERTYRDFQAHLRRHPPR